MLVSHSKSFGNSHGVQALCSLLEQCFQCCRDELMRCIREAPERPEGNWGEYGEADDFLRFLYDLCERGEFVTTDRLREHRALLGFLAPELFPPVCGLSLIALMSEPEIDIDIFEYIVGSIDQRSVKALNDEQRLMLRGCLAACIDVLTRDGVLQPMELSENLNLLS